MTLNYIKLKYKEINANTKLWIPPSHHICLTFNNLAHIIGDGTGRFLLSYCYKKGWIMHGNKTAVIGQFQKARGVGKLGCGCLVCHQTPDNLIRDNEVYHLGWTKYFSLTIHTSYEQLPQLSVPLTIRNLPCDICNNRFYTQVQ